jgi:methylphosphotriester-DNA--protein-cysteine methyltransferase
MNDQKTGSKSMRQVEELAVAMTQQPTLEKAAEAAGISISTARRLRKTSAFQEQYAALRGRTVARALEVLQESATEAANTIIEIMRDRKAPASIRLRAAERVLELGVQGEIAKDVETRVDDIEGAICELADPNIAIPMA